MQKFSQIQYSLDRKTYENHVLYRYASIESIESKKRESNDVQKWEKLKLRMYMRNRGNFHSIISSKLRQVLS